MQDEHQGSSSPAEPRGAEIGNQIDMVHDDEIEIPAERPAKFPDQPDLVSRQPCQ